MIVNDIDIGYKPYRRMWDHITGAALHENKEATAKSTSQDGGMAVNFG